MTTIPKDLCDLLIYLLEEKKPLSIPFCFCINDSEQIEILDFPVVVESLQEGQAPQYAPYFLVENVLGIPKKVLVKAYLLAREEFFEITYRLSSGKDLHMGIFFYVRQ